LLRDSPITKHDNGKRCDECVHRPSDENLLELQLKSRDNGFGTGPVLHFKDSKIIEHADCTKFWPCCDKEAPGGVGSECNLLDHIPNSRTNKNGQSSTCAIHHRSKKHVTDSKGKCKLWSLERFTSNSSTTCTGESTVFNHNLSTLFTFRLNLGVTKYPLELHHALLPKIRELSIPKQSTLPIPEKGRHRPVVPKPIPEKRKHQGVLPKQTSEQGNHQGVESPSHMQYEHTEREKQKEPKSRYKTLHFKKKRGRPMEGPHIQYI
jgi:hypothetical protein